MNSRITANVFADVLTVSAAIHMEMSLATNQIVVQNLIGRCDNVGVFPVLRPDREGSGNGRDHKIHNNIFTRCDKGGSSVPA